MATTEGPLACPRCGRKHSPEERFCHECGMPLVHAGRGDEAPVTEAHGRARKVKPQYTGGELVKIAGGRNQAEAELIQGILLEEGIPSVLRRTRGFDVPDFLAAGPRDVLVPEAAAADAVELLQQVEPESGGRPGETLAGPGTPAAAESGERPLRLLIGVMVALAAAAAIVWVLYELTL
jgi:zinc-ribbon domain